MLKNYQCNPINLHTKSNDDKYNHKLSIRFIWSQIRSIDCALCTRRIWSCSARDKNDLFSFQSVVRTYSSHLEQMGDYQTMSRPNWLGCTWVVQEKVINVMGGIRTSYIYYQTKRLVLVWDTLSALKYHLNTKSQNGVLFNYAILPCKDKTQHKFVSVNLRLKLFCRYIYDDISVYQERRRLLWLRK